MVNIVTNTLLTLFQFILRIFKKAVCCLRRRRRLSCEPIPLTNIGVVPNVEKEADGQSWGTWDDGTDRGLTVVTTGNPIDPVQQQIEFYRQQRMALAKKEENVEPKIDYFQDMTPTIIKPKKLLLQSKENEEHLNMNNFSLAPDPVFNSSELGVWEDTQSWEDQTQLNWDANEMIREKKKMEREERLARQQRKKFEKKPRISVDPLQ